MPKPALNMLIVASCEPPPTAGNCNIDPTMLEPISTTS